MITFETSSRKKYAAKIHHDVEQGRTTVLIEELLPEDTDTKLENLIPTIYTGEAKLSARDMYSRSVGRKKAFERALKKANFSEEDRKAFWKVWFDQIPKDGGLAREDLLFLTMPSIDYIPVVNNNYKMYYVGHWNGNMVVVGTKSNKLTRRLIQNQFSKYREGKIVFLDEFIFLK